METLFPNTPAKELSLVQKEMNKNTKIALREGAYIPVLRIHALHRNVIVLAASRIEGTWKAYCAPVAGVDHEKEYIHVHEHGVDVGGNIARAIFPQFKGVPYAK